MTIVDWSKLPEPLMEALLPFQREGVSFAVEKNGRCLIADEMGLGKTLQAISAACMFRNEWPLLVIVPSCVKYCWIEEIEKWLPDILPQDINLIQSGADASGIADSPISIVTYGLLRIPSAKLIQETIRRRKFQVVICDESHYLKNTKTLSSRIIVPIIKMAKRRILLSGTPALARPVELYPQLDAVCPGKWDTFWKFTERYCEPRYLYYGGKRQRKVDGASNLEELQQRMSGMLMIRREKSQVLTELPPKQRQRVLFELKDSSLKKDISKRFDSLRQNIHKGNRTFQQLANSMESLADDHHGNGGPASASAQEDDDGLAVFRDVSSLYRMSGEAKIGPVREYIEMLCENEDLKFLVFAYHHNMMDGVEQALHTKKVRFVRIDGHTKPVDRQAYVSQFQSDPSTRVAILSILAAGVGLTLTSAKLVVFAELYWTPGVMVQCEDRAHRIGQTGRLSVHYLVAKNTMDEWVWSSVCKKAVVTSTALTGKCRKLEHGEGDQHQIDVLSKADAWIPQESDEADVEDVGQLIKSQRQPDQPSILDFLSSQRRQNISSGPEYGNINNGGIKKTIVGSHSTRHGHLRFASPMTKIKAANKNLDNSLIVIDSDEEAEEFKSAKKERRKVKGSSKKIEAMIDEMTEKKKENCESSSRLQNIRKDGDKIIAFSSQEEEDVKSLSGSDDLFSGKSSDSDSDSLPDVYLGLNWEKRKLQRNHEGLDFNTDSNGSGRNLNHDVIENKKVCEDFDSKSLRGTISRKRKLSNEELSVTGELTSNITEQNPQLNGEQSSESEQKMLPATGTEYSLSSNSYKVKVLLAENSQSPDSSPSKSTTALPHNDNSVFHRAGKDVDKLDFCYENLGSENQEFDGDKSLCFTLKTSSLTPLKGNQQIQLESENPNQWPCSMCTFLNHQDLGQCEICDTPKKMKTRNKNKVVKKKISSQVPHQENCNQHLCDSQSTIVTSDLISGKNTSVYTKSKDSSSGGSTPSSTCIDKNILDSNCVRKGSIVDDFGGGGICVLKETGVTDSYGANNEIENVGEKDNESDNSFFDGTGDGRLNDVENYEIENIYSDEEGEVKMKNSVLRRDSKCCEIENVCSEDDDVNDCNQMGKECSLEKCLKLSTKYDNNVNGLDKVTDITVANSRVLEYSKDDRKEDSQVRCERSEVDRIEDSVIQCERVGVNNDQGDSISCDELNHEDFDKIEDFLSKNGHIGVDTHRPPDLTGKANNIQSCIVSVGHKSNCVTSALSSYLSSPFSSTSSHIPPQTTTVSTQPLPTSSKTAGQPDSTARANPSIIHTDASAPPSFPSCHKRFQFSCSLHTGRIYLYDERGQSLKVNFHPVDIEMGNTDRLPNFLKQPNHFCLLQRFVREWMGLSATKRRVITKQGLVFERPVQAYDSVRSVHGSTQRHLTTDNLSLAAEKAESIQGQVRVIHRPNQDMGVMEGTDGNQGKLQHGQGTAQVVTSDGIPLCLQCHKPYTNALLPTQVITRPENAWQLRLCSRTCMDKYWTLKHASYLRDQILEVEKGICRMCNFDAQAFYNRMKITKDLRQRADMVNKSPYHKLGPKAREKLVTQVMQGQFWHVDHIIPVWRGGGMCDLDNLRTLCTPCHAKVTKEQASQRANIRKLSTAVSSGDITAFFKKT